MRLQLRGGNLVSTVKGNPFGAFRQQCVEAINYAFSQLGISNVDVILEVPPPVIGAELAFPSFTVAKQAGFPPRVLAEKIVEIIRPLNMRFIDKVEVAGAGYVNFYVSYPELACETFKAVVDLDENYGHLKVDKPLRIIVEHTSANPIHPLHIGAARNAVLGDTLARLLKARGHDVKTHFYIDDVGLQVSIAAYGYDKLGRIKPEGKPDRFIGLIYAMTSCIVEIWRLKKRLKEIDELGEGFEDERAKILGELSDWASVSKELRDRNPDLFDKLLEEINSDPNPPESIARLDLLYEMGDERVTKLVRELCNLCIEGFKETLERANIKHDSWDWESDIVWSSRVKEVLDKLKATPFVKVDGGALIFDAEQAANALNLKKELGVSDLYEFPKLTLVRSDGRTLYTTRDIAYTLWQFEHADKVIHVIGAEQTLPQLQLRIALAVLGRRDLALNFVHYAYELVRLPGFKMSSRRGRYVEFDKIIDEAVERARAEVVKRSSNLSEEQISRISVAVGVGAVRYALLCISPSKRMTFTWDRVLNFDQNSAPFIQYAHARACNILAKVDGLPENYDAKLLTHKLEKSLILQVSKFPEVVAEAADSLKVELLPDFTNSLALTFNAFYDAVPVLKAEPEELRNARLQLVNAVRVTLRNALNLMGIEAPTRM